MITLLRLHHSLILAFLAACSTDGGQQNSEPGPQTNGANQINMAGSQPQAPLSTAELTTALAEANTQIDAAFLEPTLGIDIHSNPIRDSRDELRRRLAACGNDACRQAQLSEQLNRFRFALGLAHEVDPAIPWRSGVFDLNQGGADGSLTILPLGEGRIMARINTVATPDGRWICDLAATGELRPGGSADMRVIGQDINFQLETVAPDRITVRHANPENLPRVCGVGGDFAGSYRSHRP